MEFVSEDMFKALPHCLLFGSSFHHKLEQDERCWYPFGKYMRPWKEFFGLSFEECDHGLKRNRIGLWDHLKNAGGNMESVMHIGVHEYLLKKYSKYNGTLSHSSIYKRTKGHMKEYKIAKKIEDENITQSVKV